MARRRSDRDVDLQELVERHGFRARYATVQRFVRKLVGETSPERVMIATRPGVDYGDGPMVRECSGGKSNARGASC